MSWYVGSVLFWLIYFPVILFLQIILFFVPKISERRKFENKNGKEVGSKSFRPVNLKADLCFEFSSEGEYQQVASLIDDALAMGKRLELVFFSPSVEKTVLELYNRYPEQIRYLRYSVLLPTFSNWITANTLIMVRYDLFPEFLLWSLKPGNKLKFIWVTFKKERVSGKSISIFKQAFLKHSSQIIFATTQDEKLGNSLGLKGLSYDFRMEQIRRRVANREQKFSQIFPKYSSLKGLLDQYPRHKRVMVGNAWPVDMTLLENIPQDVLVVIVPHQLRPEIILEMKNTLAKFNRAPLVVSDTAGEFQGNTLILDKKGVLCELYADFGKSYVGGGFGVSVHSILEPLVAGSGQIACGPVNHRSTEFDVAVSFGNMKEVRNAQEFSTWVTESPSTHQVHDKLNSELKSYLQYQKEVLSC